MGAGRRRHRSQGHGREDPRGLEGGNDAAAHLAAVQVFIGLVDVIQAVVAGHEAVEVQLAGLVEVDDAVHVDGGAGAAVVAALEGLLLADEGDGVDGGVVADGCEANDDDGAALAGGVVGGGDGGGGAEDLEGVVGAEAAGDLLDLADGVLLGGVDGVRGAEAHGELELTFVDVDGDDLAGVDEAGPLDDVEADAAAADHGDGAARLDLGVEDDSADAGGDAAADEGGLGHGEVGGDGDAAGVGYDGLLGEAGDLAHVGDALLAPMEAGGAIEEGAAGGGVGVAEVGAADGAEVAVAAVGHEGQDDVVAGAEGGHLLPDLGDDGGALMAEDGREVDACFAAHEVEVAAADARGGDADLDLVVLGGVELDVLKGEWLTVLVEDRCLHGRLLSTGDGGGGLTCRGE